MQQDGSPLEDEESARWVLDGEDVGRGLDVWLEAPAVGKHTVELVVGRSARACDCPRSGSSTPRPTSGVTTRRRTEPPMLRGMTPYVLTAR